MGSRGGTFHGFDTMSASREPELLQTRVADDTRAITARIPAPYGRHLGGVRFVQRGSVMEAVHLASGMADKCAASRVPIGGQKALIICSSGVPTMPKERADILRRHLERVLAVTTSGVYGPDMNCGSEVLDELATDPALADHVTGLSEVRLGLDINKRALTAHGLACAIDEAVKGLALQRRRVTIQGFGSVGAALALLLHEAGYEIVGVSNAEGVLWSEAPLDPWLLSQSRAGYGDAGLARAASSAVPAARFARDPDRLLALPTDVFVPAARTTVLALESERGAAEEENPDVTGVERFLEETGCSLIAEAANHPITEPGEEYLARNGVTILPDVLVNTGGMVGCYAEWRYRPSIEDGTLGLDELAERCRRYSEQSIRANVRVLRTSTLVPRLATAEIIADNRRGMVGRRSTDDLFLGMGDG
jgi:glutamate dehydrogenase/leucine dehydrogenase